MKPVKGAIQAVKLLSKKYDVYLLSTAPWKNPSAWHNKVEWVHNHLGFESGSAAYKRLIISHHKHLNVGDYLIDDRKHNGAGDFEEWNKSRGAKHIWFGSAHAKSGRPGDFPDWDSVLKHLMPELFTFERWLGGDREAVNAVADEFNFNADAFGISSESSTEVYRAAVLAHVVHLAQKDKSGEPYIGHPRRVYAIARDLSLPVGGFSDSEVEAGLCAALLHDVVEDSGDDFYRQISLGDLSSLGFSALTVELVELLTYNKAQDKNEYLARIAANPLAKAVKLADTCDNMNKARMAALPDQKREELAAKYAGYMQVLGFDVATPWFAGSINN